MHIRVVFTVQQVLPLTGQSESAGTRQLRLASYQSLEHLEQILSRPPKDKEVNKPEHRGSHIKYKIPRLIRIGAYFSFIKNGSTM